MKIWVLSWTHSNNFYHEYYQTAEKAYDALIKQINEEAEDIAANDLVYEDEKNDFDKYVKNNIATINKAKGDKVSDFFLFFEGVRWKVEEVEIL